MSLQVWLPLTGNLNNYGVSDLKFSLLNASYTTLTSAGKIGSCYTNSSNTAGGIMSDKMLALGNNQTMCCWVKFNSFYTSSSLTGIGGQHRYYNCTGMGLTAKYESATTGRLSVNTGTGSTRTYNSYCGNTILSAGTWYHVAYTYNGTTIKLYVNGTLDGTFTFTGMSVPADYCHLFTWSADQSSGAILHNNYLLNGYLNDFRIYDNCLSAAEIKDLAKGLVAHYSLTDCMPYTNLAKNSTYVIYNNYGVSASLTKLSEQFGKCDVYRLTMTPTNGSLDSFRYELGSHGIYDFYRTFAASTKYCFWVYYRPVTHFDIRVGGTASNIGGWTEIEPKYYGGGWYRVGQYRDGSVTSAKTDNIFTSFYTPTAAVGVPISIDFCCPHLVEGYDYILEDGDYQQTTLNYNISDSSGYKYTGSTSSSAAPVTVETSPRSNRSLYFNSASKNLALNASFLSTFTTGSVSFWAKVGTSGSAGILPFTGQSTSYYLMASERWTGGFYNGGVSAAGTITYYVDGVVDNTPPGTDAIWHHYCVTGVNMSTWTALKLNNYANGWDSPNIIYSDIRFYNTVLSAADVADLANAPIKIASDGALITNGEVVE